MDEKVDINVADVERLASLPGIGMKIAARIVEYRTAVHPFEEVIELAAVPGISQRMVEAIADQVVVNESPAASTAEMVESEAAEIEEETAVEPESGEPEMEEETAVANVEELEPEAEMAEEESEETEREETIEEAEEEDDLPVVVTMLEADPGRDTSDERAIANPVIRPAQQMVVEPVSHRHSHLWHSFLSAAAGVIFGSMLTLGLLYLLNGTLHFAGDSRATDLQIQLETETSTIRQSQSSMADELGGLAGEVTALDSQQAASEEALSNVADDISALEEQTADLNERLETINQAAEKFDSFLTGMRDLLITLQGVPEVTSTAEPVTATTTIPATGATQTAPPETTPTPTGTAESPQGSSPTRTPRPTATPLIGG